MVKERLKNIWVLIVGLSMFSCIVTAVYLLFGVIAAAIYGIFNVIVLAYMMWEMHRAVVLDE